MQPEGCTVKPGPPIGPGPTVRVLCRRSGVSALLCSSNALLPPDPWRGPWRQLRSRLWPDPQRRTPRWAGGARGVLGAGVPGQRASGSTAARPSRRDRRPVVAVLAPGRAPERVVAEATALATQRSSPMRLLVLRRSVAFSTDAALVAVLERSADVAQRELLTRAATWIPAAVEVDVLRVPGADFDAPSTWLTRRTLGAARRLGAGVVVVPAALVSPGAAPPTITVVPVDDEDDGREGGAAEGTGRPRTLGV